MKKVLKFTTTRTWVFKSSEIVKPVPFTGKWLHIDWKGSMTVPHGYSWDGCSPKIKIFGKIFGTPDGKIGRLGLPKTYLASLLHDALYQYKKEICVTRKQADLAFLEELEIANFKYAKLYYRAVRIFGGLYGKWRIK